MRVFSFELDARATHLNEFKGFLIHTFKELSIEIQLLERIEDLSQLGPCDWLLINWPEETLRWSYNKQHARDLVGRLSTGLHEFKIMWIYHNNKSHYAKHWNILYHALELRADVIVTMNTRSQSRLLQRKESRKGQKVLCCPHPHCYPEHSGNLIGNDILIFGQLRHIWERMVALLVIAAAMLSGRKIRFSATPFKGIMGTVIYKLIRKHKGVIISPSPLLGEELVRWFRSSSTICLIRKQDKCNSGVLIYALQNHKKIVTTKFDAIFDFVHYSNLTIVEQPWSIQAWRLAFQANESGNIDPLVSLYDGKAINQKWRNTVRDCLLTDGEPIN